LYALAVTCITLVTGKQPNELFDTFNNQWNWRSQAQVSDRFAQILDRMLLPAPNQRFQSAQEVLNAINAINQTTPPPQPVAPTQVPSARPVAPAPVSLPTPAPTQPPAPVPLPPKPRFSLIEILAGAAFTGFEGGLLWIALSSLLSSPEISIGLLGMVIGGLIFAQYRRIIEGKDLPIIAGITLLIVMLLSRVKPLIASPIPETPAIAGVLFVAIVAAAGAIAITALFRLIYKLLSSMF